jgi:hypothetical protein
MNNIVESIQKNLGYPMIYKIDPNVQDVKFQDKTAGTAALAQAAIPSVIYGVLHHYQYNTDEFNSLDKKEKLLPQLFGNKTTELVARIALYAGASPDTAKDEMEHIAAETLRFITESMKGKNENELSIFASNHKNNALMYLPASINIGEIFLDNTIDDRTHKMEGPVSGLMHYFETYFDNPEKNKG